MFFDAKVDLWFLVLFYGIGAWMLIAVPLVWRRRPASAGLLVAIGVLFVGIAWSVDRVRYEITSDAHLDVHGWPWNGRLTRLDGISRIEPSNDARASQAASLDRLRIDYVDAGRERVVFIAVRDEVGFLDAVVSSTPLLHRTPRGVAR